jgi:hypothetical protein
VGVKWAWPRRWSTKWLQWLRSLSLSGSGSRVAIGAYGISGSTGQLWKSVLSSGCVSLIWSSCCTSSQIVFKHAMNNKLMSSSCV